MTIDGLKEFTKTHQQKLVLTTGYLLVALLAFGLGRLTTPRQQAPAIKIDTAQTSPSNYSPTVAGIQSENTTTPAIASTTNSDSNCEGKIKGSSSMIYHLPGGAFYKTTTHPIRCFNTEAEAIAAGFRKSTR